MTRALSSVKNLAVTMHMFEKTVQMGIEDNANYKPAGICHKLVTAGRKKR
jgi:hypothetical protein